MSNNTNTMNISYFLGELHRLYNLSVINNELIQKAMTAKTNYVDIEIETAGGKQTIQIPSFTHIMSQLNSFKSNLEAITTLQDGSGYAILVNQATGVVRELFELSHSKAPFIDTNIRASISVDKAVVDDFNMLDDLYTKNVCMRLDITNASKQYTRDVILTKVRINDVKTFDERINELMSEQSYERTINFLKKNNIEFEVVKHKLQVEFYKSRYFGEFSILSAEEQQSSLVLKLDTTNYTDLASNVTGSKELVVGDKLAHLNNNTLFEVTNVNLSTNTVIVKRIYGYANIQVGVDSLVYVDSAVKRYVNMPIRFRDNGVYFIDTTHSIHGTQSRTSISQSYSSKHSTITIDDNTMSIDNFIKNYNAEDVGAFLKSMLLQYDIPLKRAVKPSKPELSKDMLNVTQINKHLVEGSDIDYIKQLYASQKKLSSDIAISNDKINGYRTALEQSNYKNENDRKTINTNLSNEIANMQQLSKQYATVINELSNKDIGLYASTYAPKYRVRGFWPIESALQSEYTRDQHIIAYRVQYRYVSANDTIAKSDSYSVKQNINGEEVETTGSFSVWNEFITPTRQRFIDEKGNLRFVENNISDNDQININQLDIAISQNEQVDVRIKAITEVGWPNVLTESEWSDIVRVKFPIEYSSEIDFTKLEEEVKQEKQKLELHQLLDNAGITKHIQNSITEQHTYFAHKAIDIDSGFLTPELNKVNLFVKLTDMQKQIDRLTNIIINNTNTLKAVIVDNLGNEYVVTNNATIKVFAGFYTDAATAKPSGDIVNAQLYLKLSNTENTQIYSLMPDDLTTPIANSGYDKAAIGYLSSNSAQLPLGTKQTNNQIVYLRNKNVINNFELYKIDDSEIATTIDPSQLDVNAPQKDVVHINTTGDIEATAYGNNINNFDFIAMHKNHPEFESSGANATLKRRLTKYSKILKMFNESSQQLGYKDSEIKVMYETNDKYLIGAKTTGAYLTLNATLDTALHTNTNAKDSFKEIKADNDLLIPILFQYRMSDALGNIAGIKGYSNQNLTYTRTIGIDLLLNGKLIQFDLEVSAQYSSNSLSTNNLPKLSSLFNKNNAPTLQP